MESDRKRRRDRGSEKQKIIIRRKREELQGGGGLRGRDDRRNNKGEMKEYIYMEEKREYRNNTREKTVCVCLCVCEKTRGGKKKKNPKVNKREKKSTRGGSRTHEPEGPELEPDAFDHSATRVKTRRDSARFLVYNQSRVVALFRGRRPTTSSLYKTFKNTISASTFAVFRVTL